MSETPFREPGRHTPAKGVHVSLGGPNWVFLTVCTEKRERWLAQTSMQRVVQRHLGTHGDGVVGERLSPDARSSASVLRAA